MSAIEEGIVKALRQTDEMARSHGAGLGVDIDRICQRFLSRAENGLKKYGVSVERTDLTRLEWLNHALEELMDANVYMARIWSDYGMESGAGGMAKRLDMLSDISILVMRVHKLIEEEERRNATTQ